jgi:hypothetical protein
LSGIEKVFVCQPNSRKFFTPKKSMQEVADKDHEHVIVKGLNFRRHPAAASYEIKIGTGCLQI